MPKRKSWLEKKVNRKIGAQKRKVKAKARKAITGSPYKTKTRAKRAARKAVTGSTRRSGCGCLLALIQLLALTGILMIAARAW